MSSASALRIEIEAALAKRIPSALTPAPRVIRPVAPSGIAPLDDLLSGGLPLGAITEIAGPECSGRTSLGLAFLARITGVGKVCAWIDASDTMHPESAAAAGVSLSHLLWVRCGAAAAQPASRTTGFALSEKCFAPSPITKGLHGGGMGGHPRDEVKGLSNAVGNLLRPEAVSSPFAVARWEGRQPGATDTPVESPQMRQPGKVPARPLTRIDQALRVADLLLQAGGFSAIVLDLAGIAPEHALRVPAATWFRYRAAAERTQAVMLLLTQHACAKSSAGLVLRMLPCGPVRKEETVFIGTRHHAEVMRERFAATAGNVIPLRKPPQSERGNHRIAGWQTQTAWAGRR